MNLRELLFLHAASGGGGSLVENTATGNPVAFNTNVAKPLNSVTVPLTYKQSGTGDPSPSNIRPISGVSGLFCVHAKKNMGYLRGYSAENKNYDVAGTLSNIYGTTISTTSPESSLVITQSTSTTDYAKNNYRNGYMIFRTDNMVVGQYYDVSIKVTNITSNPLEIALSELGLVSPSGGVTSPTEAIGNVVIWKNMLYKDTPGRQAWELRNCGMSCTVSEFMVTPANTNDGVYEPYDGAKLDVTFPALGTNLLKITNENIHVFGSGTITPINNYGYSWPASVNGGFIVPCKPNTQYTYKVKYEDNLAGWYYRVWYSDTTTFVNNETTRIVSTPYSSANEVTFTTPSDANYLLVGCYVYSAAAAGGSVTEVQLTEGSSVLPYEPYNNSVYGGSLDLVSGVLTLNWKLFEAKSLTWETTSQSSNGVFICRNIGTARDSSKKLNIVCNQYKTIDQDISISVMDDLSIKGNELEKTRVYIRNSNYTDADSFAATLDDVYFACELETPITVQLTPAQASAFVGYNTVWTNTAGNLTIKYLDKA